VSYLFLRTAKMVFQKFTHHFSDKESLLAHDDAFPDVWEELECGQAAFGSRSALISSNVLPFSVACWPVKDCQR